MWCTSSSAAAKRLRTVPSSLRRSGPRAIPRSSPASTCVSSSRVAISLRRRWSAPSPCRPRSIAPPRSCYRRRPGSRTISRWSTRPPGKCRAAAKRGPGRRPGIGLAARSGGSDRDLPRLLRLGRLRQGDRQQSLPEARLDLLDIDPVGKREAALEGAVAALAQIIVLLLLLALFPLLAPDGQ